MLTILRECFAARRALVSRDRADRVPYLTLFDIDTRGGAATFGRKQRSAMIDIGIGGALGNRELNMNYRSSRCDSVCRQRTSRPRPRVVYVAPGGVYIGGGTVYGIQAPSNGNGTMSNHLRRRRRRAGAHTICGADSGRTGRRLWGGGPHGLNGNGDGHAIPTARRRPTTNAIRRRAPMAGGASSRGRQRRYPTTARDAGTAAVATDRALLVETQPP